MLVKFGGFFCCFLTVTHVEVEKQVLLKKYTFKHFLGGTFVRFSFLHCAEQMKNKLLHKLFRKGNCEDLHKLFEFMGFFSFLTFIIFVKNKRIAFAFFHILSVLMLIVDSNYKIPMSLKISKVMRCVLGNITRICTRTNDKMNIEQFDKLNKFFSWCHGKMANIFPTM